MTTSPADELRTAAALLRARATTATPSPWTQTGIGDFGWYIDGPGIETADSDQGRADADYIALMHPGVGAALADWLDRMADANEAANDWTFGLIATLNLEALAVARQINGTP
ncbi:hypothetical protein [Streptomyces sp. NBC_01716]|uniref:hypothetical protein n=1 Tax=Streptomyces sp. NBC_01716 TaxID=2975917 RepID=UPI002E379DE8|nr:hypothetical protein [Streptomyces sp. NBC_01716]